MRDIVAVNLGCGTHIAEGWINLDNSPNIYLSRFNLIKKLLYKIGLINDAQFKAEFSKNIQFRDLRKPLPFKDNSVDYVYSSHFLEHLSKEQAIITLDEIYRVLKPNGIIRIVIPDLDFYINKYLKDKETINKTKSSDDFIFGLNIITKSRDPHMWMYNSDALIERFKQAGFKNVVKCEYKKGKCKDVEILDYLPETSLHVEGVK